MLQKPANQTNQCAHAHTQKEELEAVKGFLFFALGAMRKLPDFKGVVFRGNRTADIVGREYTPGREIFWSAFTSCTTDAEMAKRFAGPRGVVFRIRVNSGKDVSAFSALGGEKEVLLPPNAGLVVSGELGVETAEGRPILDLVEKAGRFRW